MSQDRAQAQADQFMVGQEEDRGEEAAQGKEEPWEESPRKGPLQGRRAQGEGQVNNFVSCPRRVSEGEGAVGGRACEHFPPQPTS